MNSGSKKKTSLIGKKRYENDCNMQSNWNKHLVKQKTNKQSPEKETITAAYVHYENFEKYFLI